MNKNIEQLKKWKELISSFPRYNIVKVKEKILEINKEDNLNKKRAIRKDLINGTLYVVLNFIWNSGFLCLNSSLYDMDDIICSCIEVWIEYLDNGRIYNISTFSDLFSSSFYSKVVFNTINQKFPIAEFTVLSTKDFGDVLHTFVNMKQKNETLKYEDFIKILSEKQRKNIVFNSNILEEEKLKNTYALLNSIYKTINYTNIPINRVSLIQYMLIDSALSLMS